MTVSNSVERQYRPRGLVGSDLVHARRVAAAHDDASTTTRDFEGDHELMNHAAAR